MKSYMCGCKEGYRAFGFCSTHALDPKRDEINRFWWNKYTETDWEGYKNDLVVGLKLEVLDNEGSHLCTEPGCTNLVAYDDEPKCYNHSPDSGSTVRGYSYKAQHLRD